MRQPTWVDTHTAVSYTHLGQGAVLGDKARVQRVVGQHLGRLDLGQAHTAGHPGLRLGRQAAGKHRHRIAAFQFPAGRGLRAQHRAHFHILIHFSLEKDLQAQAAHFLTGGILFPALDVGHRHLLDAFADAQGDGSVFFHLFGRFGALVEDDALIVFAAVLLLPVDVKILVGFVPLHFFAGHFVKAGQLHVCLLYTSRCV